MQVGILVYNTSKEIVLANTPLSNIFGYTIDELLENKVNLLFKSNNLIDEFIKNPQKEKFKSAIELIGIIKNGDEINLEINFGKIEYENQCYFKALISDISLRKEKEKEILNLAAKLEEEVKLRTIELEDAIKHLKTSLDKEKELNHLKTKFITLASHEFKTPLSVILTSTELISKYSDLQLPKKRDAHVSKVKIMVNHLNGMLDDFLTLENIELGNIKPTYSYFKFNKLVKEIIKNTKPFLKNKQTITFENNNGEMIYQDSKILKIILTNLLYNAIKYSKEIGKINVKIDANNTHIYLTVNDDGIGIPDNEQNLIFNRFFRAKNAMFYPGTGIGLNIVKGYVNKLEGAISFKSIENEGTSFYVKLPKISSHE